MSRADVGCSALRHSAGVLFYENRQCRGSCEIDTGTALPGTALPMCCGTSLRELVAALKNASPLCGCVCVSACVQLWGDCISKTGNRSHNYEEM